MGKKTLKSMALFLVVVIMMMGLTACGEDMSDSPYVGTWSATTAEYSGIEMGVAEILGGEFDLTLTEKGKATVNIAGEEDSGKWEESANGFLIDGELEFVMEGNVAVLDYDGVILKFEQQ